MSERTCCQTHADTCRFGRDHRWGIGWHGGSLSGVGVGAPGWHTCALCIDCKGICYVDNEEPCAACAAA